LAETAELPGFSDSHHEPNDEKQDILIPREFAYVIVRQIGDRYRNERCEAFCAMQAVAFTVDRLIAGVRPVPKHLIVAMHRQYVEFRRVREGGYGPELARAKARYDSARDAVMLARVGSGETVPI